MKPYSHGRPKHDVCRQSAYARLIRDDLQVKLGGVCAKCGTKEKLSFDLIIPNGVKHHGEISWCHRMIYYRRQFEAGNLQLLCTFHNSQKKDKIESARRPRRPRAPAPASLYQDGPESSPAVTQALYPNPF